MTGYYERFIDRFPGIDALSGASPDDVLLQWQGMGYYRRARNLHAAAVVVRDHHGGSIPDSYEALRTLPGVGEYTASAVASIAFGEPVAAIDGNVHAARALRGIAAAGGSHIDVDR